MRYKISNILWGLFWIALGTIIAGNAFGWWDVSLFFDGWWTLFIIVPCGISMVSQGFGTFSTIGFALGILLLLNCQGIVVAAQFRKLVVPLMLILIGIIMITKSIFRKDVNVKATYGPEAYYCATFSGNHVNYPNTIFNGAELDSIFGNVTLDLRGAIINQDVCINATSIFGGADIIVPNFVNVKVNSTSFFGGVDNKVKRRAQVDGPTIYVNATCMFGGVDIK